MEHGIRNRVVIRNDWHEYDSRRGMLRFERIGLTLFVLATVSYVGWAYLTEVSQIFTRLVG